jgi:hypothetical protein
MQVALMLIGTPSWANGGRTWQWAPKNSRDFADFAAAAARRYPNVHLWMIWGEPTRQANFRPLSLVRWNARRLTSAQATGPHIYASMLDGAYSSLKTVNRNNLVIGGMTFSAGDIVTKLWIQNLVLPDGRRPRLDLWGHNPFSYRAPDLSNRPSPWNQVDFSDLPRLAGMVDATFGHGRHIPLFLSEWTLPTSPNDGEFGFWVDPPVQASWIKKAFAIVHRWRQIYALGWIHLEDDPPQTYGGLMTAAGRPKPGFFAFQRG